jgi:hypothetical protein
MRVRWRAILAALAPFLIACDGKSVADRLSEHERVRVSWEQTARLVGGDWARRAVPDAYAIRTLERARDDLRSESQSLAKDDIPTGDARRLREALEGTRAFVDTVARAIRAGDRRATSGVVEHERPAPVDSLLEAAGLR